jgi:hypothetical protein
MRQYRIDELRPGDHEKIKSYMDKSFGPSALNNLYWVPLEVPLLDEVQRAHKDCQPFFFAVELQPESVTFELLIRTKNRVRCDCIHYATWEQRESIIRFADQLFETLGIAT